MPFATLNEINIYYEDKGTGSVVVLLSGLASDSQSWAVVANQLSKHFRVICPDNRCSGRTDSATTQISIDQMADDTVALLNHLHIDKAMVLGHSMGGFIAQTIAIKYPSLVQKLILEATSTFVSPRNQLLFDNLASLSEAGTDARTWFTTLFFWLFHPSFFINTEIVQAALSLSINYPFNPSVVSFRKQTDCIRNFQSGVVETIAAPTLIISGSHDLVFGYEETEELCNKIPKAQHQEISEAGHAIHVDQSEKFVGIVTDFFLQD